MPVSLLVAPRLKGGYRLDADEPTVEWLRQRRTAGDAVVLHGYDEAATKKRRGEFATLPAHEANLRLMGADRVLEHLGLRTRLFAAPGWTVSQGAVTALPRNGFRLVAGIGGDHRPDAPDDGPVAGARHRRRLPHRAVVVSHPGAAAERTARRAGTVRLAVSAKQLRKPGPRQALLDAIDLALMHRCAPAVYRWVPKPALTDAA